MLPEYRGTQHISFEPIKPALNGRTSAMELGTGFEYQPQFAFIMPALEAIRQEAVAKHDKKQADRQAYEKIKAEVLV